MCNKVKRKLLLSWFIIVHFYVFVSLWSSIIEYWQYSFVGPFSRIICMSHLDIDLSHWGGGGTMNTSPPSIHKTNSSYFTCWEDNTLRSRQLSSFFNHYMIFLFNVGLHLYMHTQPIELYFKHVLVVFFFFLVNNLLYIFLICTFLITFWSTDFDFFSFFFRITLINSQLIKKFIGTFYF